MKNSGHPLSDKDLIPSILSEDLHIFGNLSARGYLDISAQIEGDVEGHSITIREKASIRGHVRGHTVHVYGRVEGSIEGSQVKLFPTSAVEGAVIHDNMVIEDGAYLNGQCLRRPQTAAEGTEHELVDLSLYRAGALPENQG